VWKRLSNNPEVLSPVALADFSTGVKLYYAKNFLENSIGYIKKLLCL
jgi:hypothetical protein